MADPATMMVAGAAIGAATNKKNPLEGAMMGAALGGGGGYLLGGAPLVGGGAPLVEGAAGGAATSILETPATMAEFMPIAQSSAPVAQAFPVNLGSFTNPMFDAASAMETQFGVMPATMSGYGGAGDVLNPATGSVITGADAAKIGNAISPMQALSAMQAMNLGKPQEQPMMRGGITRGDPRAVQQDAVLSLLAPKRLEKRKISLMG